MQVKYGKSYRLISKLINKEMYKRVNYLENYIAKLYLTLDHIQNKNLYHLLPGKEKDNGLKIVTENYPQLKAKSNPFKTIELLSKILKNFPVSQWWKSQNYGPETELCVTRHTKKQIMGRRYYCEYCDKTFIDELEARKKHLQSANHIKLRNMHYERCRDPTTILREELLKIPCRKFFQNGTCLFEGSCKYTHYSPEQLCELRQQVEQMEAAKQKLDEEKQKVASVESWLEKYERLVNKDDGNSVHTPWTFPENLAVRQDLPLSLKKFKPEHFHGDDFEEWGT